MAIVLTVVAAFSNCGSFAVHLFCPVVNPSDDVNKQLSEVILNKGMNKPSFPDIISFVERVRPSGPSLVIDYIL